MTCAPNRRSSLENFHTRHVSSSASNFTRSIMAIGRKGGRQWLVLEVSLNDSDSISQSEDCLFYIPTGRSQNLGDCMAWHVSLTKTEAASVKRSSAARATRSGDDPRGTAEATELHLRTMQKNRGVKTMSGCNNLKSDRHSPPIHFPIAPPVRVTRPRPPAWSFQP